MSISYCSWESVVALASRFYNEDLHLFYTSNHLSLVYDIVSFLHRTPISIAATYVILPEPLILTHLGGSNTPSFSGDNDHNARGVKSDIKMGRQQQQPQRPPINLITVSVPLVAKLVNMTVELPERQMKYVDSDTAFNSMLNIMQYFPSDEQVRELEVTQRARNTYCNTILGAPSASDAHVNDPLRLYIRENAVRFIQVLRLVIMCVHFQRHCDAKIPFNSHKNYKFVEMARRPPKRKRFCENTNTSVYEDNDNDCNDPLMDAQKCESDELFKRLQMVAMLTNK